MARGKTEGKKERKVKEGTEQRVKGKEKRRLERGNRVKEEKERMKELKREGETKTDFSFLQITMSQLLKHK